jgi:hypothetical protein
LNSCGFAGRAPVAAELGSEALCNPAALLPGNRESPLEVAGLHCAKGISYARDCGDGREESSTFVKQLFKNAADYVTRRFNASSAGLK